MTNHRERLTDSVTLKDIYAASGRIKSTVCKTPLELSHPLSALVGTQVRLKMENLQHTGSFKLRGAANVLASLNADQRRVGVIAPTEGESWFRACLCGTCSWHTRIHILTVFSRPD